MEQLRNKRQIYLSAYNKKCNSNINEGVESMTDVFGFIKKRLTLLVVF